MSIQLRDWFPNPPPPYAVFSFIVVLMLPFLATSIHVSARPTVRTDNEAQAVINKAITALGGFERLNAINSLLIKGKGTEIRSAEVLALKRRNEGGNQ